jgi:hypothetical protein
MVKAYLQVRDDVLFSFIDKAMEFLDGDGQIMLLVGDSGAGKTIFSHQLELLFWKYYQSDGPIPLYIHLPTIDGLDCGIVVKQLHRHDFTAEQIQDLRRHRQVTLICDGYDEYQQLLNLYHLNQFNKPDQWKAKLFISCRTDYVGPDYRSRFSQPCRARNTIQHYSSRRHLLPHFRQIIFSSTSTSTLLLPPMQ